MPKSFIHRVQADSSHKFNSIPAFILPQSENISAANGCMTATLCMCVHIVIIQALVYATRHLQLPHPNALLLISLGLNKIICTKPNPNDQVK